MCNALVTTALEREEATHVTYFFALAFLGDKKNLVVLKTVSSLAVFHSAMSIFFSVAN